MKDIVDYIKYHGTISSIRDKADKDRNIIIKFRYDILDTHTFKNEDNRVHNPYGRKGKI